MRPSSNLYNNLTPILESSDDEMKPIIEASDNESDKSLEEIPSLMEIPSNYTDSRSPTDSHDSIKQADHDFNSIDAMKKKIATTSTVISQESSKKPSKASKKRETVALIFNDDIEKGEVMAKNLSKSGCNVVAIIKNFNSIVASSLVKIPRVTVLVLNSTDPKKIAPVIEGAHRAILMTDNWESFENEKEERKAISLILACHQLKMSQLILSTIENRKSLKKKGLKSQIQKGNPPKFEGMKKARRVAKKTKVQLLHMMTAYRDYKKSDESMCLLSAGKGAPFVVRSDSRPQSKPQEIPGEIEMASPKEFSGEANGERTPVEPTVEPTVTLKPMTTEVDSLATDTIPKGSSVQTTIIIMLFLSSLLGSIWLISSHSDDIRAAIEEKLSEIDFSSLTSIRAAIEYKMEDMDSPSLPPFMHTLFESIVKFTS
mmetsp:Transcript_10505/g.16103  ORF Transcript_10505/g.16103 Transcript_10505/m.16103 type:complete len:429 (-) Transcript_10505:30-1316(-)